MNYFVSLPVETQKQATMSKHKSGKRLTKQRLAEMLQTLFQQHPNETFSLKQIFRELKLSTHPAKMLMSIPLNGRRMRPEKSSNISKKLRSKSLTPLNGPNEREHKVPNTRMVRVTNVAPFLRDT